MQLLSWAGYLNSAWTWVQLVCWATHHYARNSRHGCLQADDRLLVVSEGATGSPSSLFGPDSNESQQPAGPQLGVHHIRVPQQYIMTRYPLTHASISPDGMDIAVAGTRGLGLYSRRSNRWRLFGDVSQEKEIMVQVGSHANVFFAMVLNADQSVLSPSACLKTSGLVVWCVRTKLQSCACSTPTEYACAEDISNLICAGNCVSI